MTSPINFFYQGDKLWKVSRSQHLSNRRNKEYVKELFSRSTKTSEEPNIDKN